MKFHFKVKRMKSLDVDCCFLLSCQLPDYEDNIFHFCYLLFHYFTLDFFRKGLRFVSLYVGYFDILKKNSMKNISQELNLCPLHSMNSVLVRLSCETLNLLSINLFVPVNQFGSDKLKQKFFYSYI